MTGMKSMGILAVCIAIVLMIGGFASLSVYGNADTVTKGFTDHGCEGSSPIATDSTHPLPVNNGELLDSHAYVTSWDTNGLSEKIVMSGHLRRDLNWQSIADVGYDAFYYTVTFPIAVQVALSDAVVHRTAVTEWTSPVISCMGTNLINNNQWESLDSIIIYIQGSAVGTMKVELWAKNYVVDPYWPPNSYGPSWNKMQTDQANLLSGIGLVTVPQDVVEEGTTAHINVRTFYSHTAADPTRGGWTLQIFEPGVNPEVSNSVFSQPIADDYTGTIDWLVPMGSYKDPMDISTPANWNNKYMVYLTNELFTQSHAWLFTIGEGMMPQIPNKPTLKVLSGDMSNGGYTQGGLITIELSAIKNPIGYDVKDFIVSVQYIKAGGGDSTVILSDSHYAVTKGDNDTYTATISFVVPEAGTVSVWGDSYDIHGLNSGVAKLSIGVTPYFPPPPGGDEDIDWLGILLIIGIITAVIGALFAFIPGVPEPFKTIGYVLLFVGAACLIIYGFMTLSPSAAAVISAFMKGW